MKESYNIKVNLTCITCGESDFYYNDNKSYVKCNTCNREYLNGYNELVELNKMKIDKAIATTKQEIIKDTREEIVSLIRKALVGNKSVKFK